MYGIISRRAQRRLRQFEEFQSFVECKPHKLLKACQTRWLSLEACVNSLIEQYEALLSYSRSTEDKQAVVRRVKIVLEKPLTKAYLLFLCSALPIVNNLNRYMQQQSPILHVLYQELDGLIRKFLLRFINSEYMCAAEHVPQVCINNSEDFIGHNTLSYLEEEDGLSSEDVRKFRETIQAWWIAAAKGAVKRLPMSH